MADRRPIERARNCEASVHSPGRRDFEYEAREGLPCKPFYRVHERSDTFALLGIHTDAVGFVAELPRILAGRPMRRDKVIDQAAREVIFESDDALEYIIDGDTYVQDEPLALRLGPKVRFLRLNVV